jgi:hypothetical protein
MHCVASQPGVMKIIRNDLDQKGALAIAARR